jgi:hypothetical protein
MIYVPMKPIKTIVVDKGSYDKGFNKSVRNLKNVENKTRLKGLIDNIQCN